jgi:sulfite reductase (NADPH) flavoprotein alpha-component
MKELNILFGSQTGNAKNLAQTISNQLEEAGFSSRVLDMGQSDPESIRLMDYVVIVTSTYGDGEAPDNASEWWSFLKFTESLDLSHLNYAVLGLGDTYYPHFCQSGKDFDHFLSKHGGHPLVSRLDCDLYYEEQYGPWLESLIAVLKIKFQD